jgi:hypothetical protein
MLALGIMFELLHIQLKINYILTRKRNPSKGRMSPYKKPHVHYSLQIEIKTKWFCFPMKLFPSIYPQTIFFSRLDFILLPIVSSSPKSPYIWNIHEQLFIEKHMPVNYIH